MLEIGKRDLPLLVSAIRDAVIYNQQLLRSETLKNVEDFEEYLVSLEYFEQRIKDSYKELEKTNKDLFSYEELVREKS